MTGSKTPLLSKAVAEMAMADANAMPVVERVLVFIFLASLKFHVCQTGRNIVPISLMLSWLPVANAYTVPVFLKSA